jgi:hypothetical protein
MFVSSKTFMELVEKMTRMECEHKMEVKRLEERIETLEKRPIVLQEDQHPNAKKNPDMHTIYDELVNGVVDDKLGRVKLTDGTD